MNRLRCFLFAAIVVISSATFALGGEMQAPGKSDSTPTPTPAAMTTRQQTMAQHSQSRLKEFRLYGRTPLHTRGDPASNLQSLWATISCP